VGSSLVTLGQKMRLRITKSAQAQDQLKSHLIE
jgi:hypothetical protein